MSKTIPSQQFPGIEYVPGEGANATLTRKPGIDLWFDVFEEVGESALDEVGNALDNLDTLEALARQRLKEALMDEDHAEHDTVVEFLEHHREEIPPEDLAAMLGVENPLTLSEQALLDSLEVRSFWVCLEDEPEKALRFTLDFQFDPEFTDQILAVRVNQNQEAVDIAWES
jgi:hypothetical protein